MIGLRANESGESGPGALGVILFLVLLVVVVGLGIFAYKHFHKSANVVNDSVRTVTSSNTSSSNNQPAAESTATSTAQESPSGTSVMAISGMNIQLTLPNTLKDLIYESGTTSGTTPTGTGVTLSTQKLASLDANCGVVPASGAKSVAPGLGELVEYSGKFTASNSPDKKAYFSKQFPAFYIAYDAPGSTCSTTASTTQLASTQLKAFEAALPSMQVTP